MSDLAEAEIDFSIAEALKLIRDAQKKARRKAQRRIAKATQRRLKKAKLPSVATPWKDWRQEAEFVNDVRAVLRLDPIPMQGRNSGGRPKSVIPSET